jgi:hypothetical protein
LLARSLANVRVQRTARDLELLEVPVGELERTGSATLDRKCVLCAIARVDVAGIVGVQEGPDDEVLPTTCSLSSQGPGSTIAKL